MGTGSASGAAAGAGTVPGAGGGAANPGGRGGAPIVFTHLSTSKEILELDWHFPVAHTFKETSNEKQVGTASAWVERALPRQEAFYKINADGNRRPLLVMRECVLCKGTDHALFDRRLNNEKTKLLSQWFYCVKLPPKVLDANHSFRNLFSDKKPPHLFICTHDGKDLTAFDGKQSQSQLQKKMGDLIVDSYEKKPIPAVKAMLRFLSEFDKYDGNLQTYDNQLEREMLRPKPRKAKLAKIAKKIDATKQKRALAMKRAKAVCDLKLKIEKPVVAGDAKKKA